MQLFVVLTIGPGVAGKPIQYDLNMGDQREGEGFIPSPKYCSGPSALKEYKPPKLL